MAKGAPRDAGASARARLRALAGERGDDFEFVLGRYAIEGLLRRLSASTHRDRFILKGAMLFVLWGIDGHRVTRDVDFLGYGRITPDSLRETFLEIIAIPFPEDGLVFQAHSVEAALIREENEYGGVRVRMTATLAKAEVAIQIDVGIGDAAHDCPVVGFPTLLGGSSPQLRAYPKETPVAEKFHAMVELGGRNSRLKDFHDIYVLSGIFHFDMQRLARSIASTFQRRGREIPPEVPFGLTAQFTGDAMKRQQWTAFLRKSRVRAELPPFEEIVASLVQFLMPAVDESRNQTGRAAHWDPALRRWISESLQP